MTREEAIEYWEGLRKTFSSQLEKEENHFGRMHLQTTIDVLDTTISDLRQQDVTDTNVGSNDPLTLDELRQMDGEPVWVCFIDGVVMRDDGWFILALLNESQSILEGKHPVYKNLEVYGKTWLAYRQKPEEDNHDSN